MKLRSRQTFECAAASFDGGNPEIERAKEDLAAALVARAAYNAMRPRCFNAGGKFGTIAYPRSPEELAVYDALDRSVDEKWNRLAALKAAETEASAPCP